MKFHVAISTHNSKKGFESSTLKIDYIDRSLNSEDLRYFNYFDHLFLAHTARFTFYDWTSL